MGQFLLASLKEVFPKMWVIEGLQNSVGLNLFFLRACAYLLYQNKLSILKSSRKAHNVFHERMTEVKFRLRESFDPQILN